MATKTTKRLLLPDARDLLEYVTDSHNTQSREYLSQPKTTIPSMIKRAKLLVNKTGYLSVEKTSSDETDL